MMSDYVFRTRWRFQAPVQAVWQEIVSVEQWPSWWKYVKSVKLIHSGNDPSPNLGTIHRHVWTSRLPYKLSFDMKTTKIELYQRLEGIATGELEGIGVWTFASVNDGASTDVQYDWTVKATKLWMRLAAPIAKPAFRWNHDAVMTEGGLALARKLGVRLEFSENT